MKYKFDLFDAVYVLVLGIICIELWSVVTDKMVILYIVTFTLVNFIRGFSKGWLLGFDQGFDEGFKFKKELL